MSDTYDLIVIGGGSAGLVAAGGAAILGARVALIEKNLLGGDCLYTGCVPSKALIRSARFASDVRDARKYGFEPLVPAFGGGRFAAVTDRVRRVIGVIEKHDAPEVFEEMGVEVIFGSPRFTDAKTLEVVLRNGDTRVVKSRRFCLATGSRPAVPPIEGLAGAGFVTNEEVFGLEELPARLVVLGGGAIGTELGQAFARFGSRVTIIEAGERLLSKEEPEASNLIEATLRAEGVEVLTKTRVTAVGKNGAAKTVVCEGSGGERREIEADEILVATGRRPNVEGLDLGKAGVRFDDTRIETDAFLRTSQKHIFAAGDVTAHYQFTHMADYEAQIVIRNAFLPWPFRKKTDFRVVPWATFTGPEVGRVGLTEEEARKEFGDAAVKVYKTGFDRNDRALAEEAPEGFAKIVTKAKGGEIIGATIVGDRAGELIHEFVWAMSSRVKIGGLNRIIRVYPTLAKIVQAAGTEATLESLRSPFVRKWFARYLRIWR